MGAYFKSWRRRLGVVTLLLALISAAAWLRSFVTQDFIPFPFADESEILSLADQTFSGLASNNQSLKLFWFSKFKTTTSTEPVAGSVQRAGFATDGPSPADGSQASIELARAVSSFRGPSVTLFFSAPEPGQPEVRVKFGDEHL